MILLSHLGVFMPHNAQVHRAGATAREAPTNMAAPAPVQPLVRRRTCDARYHGLSTNGRTRPSRGHTAARHAARPPATTPPMITSPGAEHRAPAATWRSPGT